MLTRSPYWTAAQVAKAAHVAAHRNPSLTAAQRAMHRENYRAVMRVVVTHSGMAELVARRRWPQPHIEGPTARHHPAPGEALYRAVDTTAEALGRPRAPAPGTVAGFDGLGRPVIALGQPVAGPVVVPVAVPVDQLQRRGLIEKPTDTLGRPLDTSGYGPTDTLGRPLDTSPRDTLGRPLDTSPRDTLGRPPGYPTGRPTDTLGRPLDTSGYAVGGPTDTLGRPLDTSPRDTLGRPLDTLGRPLSDPTAGYLPNPDDRMYRDVHHISDRIARSALLPRSAPVAVNSIGRPIDPRRAPGLDHLGRQIGASEQPVDARGRALTRGRPFSPPVTAPSGVVPSVRRRRPKQP